MKHIFLVLFLVIIIFYGVPEFCFLVSKKIRSGWIIGTIDATKQLFLKGEENHAKKK